MSGGANTTPHGDDSSGARRVFGRRFRTELCKSYIATGSCKYHNRCMYAHGEAMLRTEEQNLADGLVSESSIRAWARANKPEGPIRPSRRGRGRYGGASSAQRSVPFGAAAAPGAASAHKASPSAPGVPSIHTDPKAASAKAAAPMHRIAQGKSLVPPPPGTTLPATTAAAPLSLAPTTVSIPPATAHSSLSSTSVQSPVQLGDTFVSFSSPAGPKLPPTPTPAMPLSPPLLGGQPQPAPPLVRMGSTVHSAGGWRRDPYALSATVVPLLATSSSTRSSPLSD